MTDLAKTRNVQTGPSNAGGVPQMSTKGMVINFKKAIDLLLNPHSRNLIFRHCYVLNKIPQKYPQTSDLVADIEEILVYVVICKEVYQERGDDTLLSALSDTCSFIRYTFKPYICVILLSGSSKLIYYPTEHDKLMDLLSCVGDLFPQLVFEV